MRYGVVLVNLGTPDSPDKSSVRAYLREFLMDKRVINLPWPLRFFLVYCIIVPKRLSAVTKLYQSIWEGDSPIRSILNKQVIALRTRLESNVDVKQHSFLVEPAMTYGSPSIEHALANLLQKGIDKLIVLPLYPQFSKTTTLPVQERLQKALKRLKISIECEFIEQYFDHPLYIEALSEQVSEKVKEGVSNLLLSYHGIPKSYVAAGDPYYEQCQLTTQLLQAALKQEPVEIFESYQSRVTSEEWLQPYTEDKVLQMLNEGKKEIAVMCPGFSADCLETIDEVGVEYKELFLDQGGESYFAFPALNVRDKHIQLMETLVLSRLCKGSC